MSEESQKIDQVAQIIGSLVTNSGTANQLLGKIIEALNNNDVIAITGSITSSGATAGIGYATGAGGTATQLTSKSTTVVLNKVTGAITMNNAALNAGVEVTFTLTNSAIETADVLIVNHSSAGTAGAYFAQCTAVAAGSCSITVSNVSGGNLSEAIVLSFVVIKGATA